MLFYCKWKYRLCEGGKIICKPYLKTIKRQNNKLKKIEKLEKLNINIDEINQTKKAYKAYLSLGKKIIFYL